MFSYGSSSFKSSRIAIFLRGAVRFLDSSGQDGSGPETRGPPPVHTPLAGDPLPLFGRGLHYKRLARRALPTAAGKRQSGQAPSSCPAEPALAGQASHLAIRAPIGTFPAQPATGPKCVGWRRRARRCIGARIRNVQNFSCREAVCFPDFLVAARFLGDPITSALCRGQGSAFSWRCSLRKSAWPQTECFAARHRPESDFRFRYPPSLRWAESPRTLPRVWQARREPGQGPSAASGSQSSDG